MVCDQRSGSLCIMDVTSCQAEDRWQHRHRAKGPYGHQLPCLTAFLHSGWCCNCTATVYDEFTWSSAEHRSLCHCTQTLHSGGGAKVAQSLFNTIVRESLVLSQGWSHVTMTRRKSLPYYLRIEVGQKDVSCTNSAPFDPCLALCCIALM